MLVNGENREVSRRSEGKVRRMVYDGGHQDLDEWNMWEIDADDVVTLLQS
jgi:hypothetical protein